MKVRVEGVINDIYYHESAFEGKQYPGYQVELFDPDFTSPTNRHWSFKFTVEQGKALNFDKPEKVAQLKNKTAEITGKLLKADRFYRLIAQEIKLR